MSQTPKIPARCRHLHADGRQCGSPALRHQPLCFQHRAAREPLPVKHLDGRLIPQLPAPDDFPAIQRAIAEVLRLLAEEEITDRRASTLLRGLSLAGQNLARHHRHVEREERRRQAADFPTEPVTAFTNHPELGPLALEEPQADGEIPNQQNQDLSPSHEVFSSTLSESEAEEPAVPATRFSPTSSSSLSAADEEKFGAMYFELSESFREKRRAFTAEKTAELEAHFQTRLEEAVLARIQALQETRLEADIAHFFHQQPNLHPAAL